MNNFNEYFEKENEVWKFKHSALTAAYKLFGLFVNFNYFYSEIADSNDNIMCIFRDNDGKTVFNKTISKHILGLAMEGNLELAKMDMEAKND